MPTTTVLTADSRRDLLIHDIRTPLATISGYAQLVLRRAAQGGPELLALVDALQHIEDAAKRVGNLLGELADVQAQSGTLVEHSGGGAAADLRTRLSRQQCRRAVPRHRAGPGRRAPHRDGTRRNDCGREPNWSRHNGDRAPTTGGVTR